METGQGSRLRGEGDGERVGESLCIRRNRFNDVCRRINLALDWIVELTPRPLDKFDLLSMFR